MGNLHEEPRPVAELAEGGETAVRAAVLRKATEAVVANARDATDCRMLLEMLGLRAAPGTRSGEEAA
ncbi:hypothetical protein [Amycolatopsis regifaucium]|uniref:Uncharacterized protein n=1 Tax=Amycolatopsis regifaucium TaxID=546365 RepID=A0A154M6C8_9PSEU|nr:hypothetical protein [Amycolatopsis regifaucium]KZB79409.1 hypothetical protein AVL48_17655 [Amycolatopsis regifaucium]OKA07590.1 hypothetical protein ATP06_0217340 [Amycolatopsis regifaucium]SFH07623.1 hypothetical protein SAMN04489731_102345 [Amycolatopsis regifaucium]